MNFRCKLFGHSWVWMFKEGTPNRWGCKRCAKYAEGTSAESPLGSGAWAYTPPDKRA